MRPGWKGIGVNQALALALALLLGLIWATDSVSVRRNQRGAEQAALRQAESEASVVALQWRETLGQVRFVQYIARKITLSELAGDTAPDDLLTDLRQNLTQAGSWISQVGAAGPDGTPIWSTVPIPAEPTPYADREVGRPQIGRLSGTLSILFTEAIRDAQGGVRAVTTVSVRAGVFKPDDQQATLLPPGTVVSVVRGDGVILASTEPNSVGTALDATEMARAGDVAPVPDQRDDLASFRAWRRIGESDLYVRVRIPAEPLLAPDRRASNENHVWVAVLGVTLAALTFSMGRALRSNRAIRVEKDTRHRAETAERLARAERLAVIGQATATIMHEINQPLSVIALSAENGLLDLEAGGSADQVAARLQRISAQVRRLRRVIDHVRTVTRPVPAPASVFDVADLIAETIVLAGTRIAAAGLSVTIDVQAGLAPLRLPREPLEQVLLNIIVNACDAYQDAPAGSRPLAISAGMRGDALLITLEDRAGGIPDAVLKRMFEPFFTTRPPNQGTGIGLTISRLAITEMGGTLTACNRDGGAAFVIRLPLDPAR